MKRSALTTCLFAAVALSIATASGVSAQGPTPGLIFDFDPALGWEGTRSNSPFLFKDVAGSEDFTAEVSIGAQTSGNWSDAGIIVRAKQLTPPGTAANHADENFTFFGSFRTTAANPDFGTTLHKRIEAGAQVQDTNVPIMADPANEPLPIRLRLVKTGADYVGWVSPDNGTTWQMQSTATATAGTGLADPAVMKEVGLSYSNFSGTLLGQTRLENFSLALGSGPTFNDNFATTFDYSGGAVQGIWTGSYNMPNLGAGGSVVAAPQRPALVVNTVTGATAIRNDLAVPLSFDYYSITSAGGRLNPASWNSLSDQNIDAGLAADFDGVGGVNAADLATWKTAFTGSTAAGDTDGDGDSDGHDFLTWQRQLGQTAGEGDSWDEAGGATSNVLAELFLNGQTTLMPGQQISLGNAFLPGAGDLAFNVGKTGDANLSQGVVVYVTTGPSAAVPEPAMLTLIGGALVSLFYASRRRLAG